MKKMNFKKAIASVAALSLVAVGFAAVPASAADVVNVTIDQKTVSVAEAQAGVPIYVRVDAPDSGINAIEFGVEVVDAGTDGVSFDIVNVSRTAQTNGGEALDLRMTAKVSDVQPTRTWLAWADANATDFAGYEMNVVQVMVTIPNPVAGKYYYINYTTNGVGVDGDGRSHLYKYGESINYLADGNVSYADGWILIEGEATTEATTTEATTTQATTTEATTTQATTTLATTTQATTTLATTTATADSTAAPITETSASETTIDDGSDEGSTTEGSTTQDNGTGSGTTTTTAGTTTTAKPNGGTTPAGNNSSPKTGATDVLPIAGAAAAVAVLGGVALVTKKKND